MDAQGGHQTELTAPPLSGGYVPSWSPEGARIAFSGMAGAGLESSAGVIYAEVWVVHAEGSHPRQLTSNFTPSGSNAPSWSPDGTRIAFASDSGTFEAYTMDPSGARIHQLTAPTLPAYPDSNVSVWSHDGQQLASWSGIELTFGQVWVMDPHGGHRVPLTNCRPRRTVITPPGPPMAVSCCTPLGRRPGS